MTVTRFVLGLWTAVCVAQTAAEPGGRSIEDLNLVGAPVTMPRFADTVLGEDSGLRRWMAERGMAWRANVLPRVSVNLLDGPVEASQQSYIGQRPTWISGVNPIFTADLRQLGWKNTQLNIGGAWRWTNWNPAGPKTVALASLYLYRSWLGKRVEVKAGYIGNDTEFVGMQVGGSLATGAQGVYAVLPYQVGMSYFPLTAPSVNVRLQGPAGTYWKVGAQRSLDAAGGVATQARNQSGFRFAPHGDRLLLINELGYLRAARAESRYVWLRAGYLHNDTLYLNRSSGRMEAGNQCLYLLADGQLEKGEAGAPGHGWYAGGTLMAAPERFNSYHRYYEGRLYKKAPWKGRPDDVLSIVGAYRGHSRFVREALVAKGRTVWEASPSLTASYSMHVARGNYLTLGLGYVRGAAISPRVADSLTFTANWGVYF